jgi:hypothetical protein
VRTCADRGPFLADGGDSVGNLYDDEEMSFGKVMTHIAQTNIRTLATVSGLKPLETLEKVAAAFADPRGGVFDKETPILVCSWLSDRLLVHFKRKLTTSS